MIHSLVTDYRNNEKRTVIIYRAAQKVNHCQIIKNVSNRINWSANEIRFLRQIKEMIKHYNIIHRYYIFSAWPTLWRQ